MRVRLMAAVAGAMLAGACAEREAAPTAGGGAATGQAPEAQMTAPLGSRENPVRCDMPDGERAYLERLRCPDGSPPRFERFGSVGVGPHGNILDGYLVHCGEDETTVFMDMYHPGYIENEPVEGFEIVEPGGG